MSTCRILLDVLVDMHECNSRTSRSKLHITASCPPQSLYLQAAADDLQDIRGKGFWDDECTFLQRTLAGAERAGKRSDANLFSMMMG